MFCLLEVGGRASGQLTVGRRMQWDSPFVFPGMTARHRAGKPKNGSWSSSNRPNLVTRRELDPSVIGDRRVKIATAPQLQYQHIRYFLSVCYNKY